MNTHVCDEMRKGAQTHSQLYSSKTEVNWVLKQDDKGKWTLQDDQHIILSAVLFCPYCGHTLASAPPKPYEPPMFGRHIHPMTGESDYDPMDY